MAREGCKTETKLNKYILLPAHIKQINNNLYKKIFPIGRNSQYGENVFYLNSPPPQWFKNFAKNAGLCVWEKSLLLVG